MGGSTRYGGSALVARRARLSQRTHNAPGRVSRQTILCPAPCDDVEASSAKVSGSGSRRVRSETNGASGRVQRRDGDGGEQGSDPMQERFDGAGRRQVEENPVLVLFDLGRHFEQREDNGARLRCGQGGV